MTKITNRIYILLISFASAMVADSLQPNQPSFTHPSFDGLVCLCVCGHFRLFHMRLEFFRMSQSERESEKEKTHSEKRSFLNQHLDGENERKKRISKLIGTTQ